MKAPLATPKPAWAPSPVLPKKRSLVVLFAALIGGLGLSAAIIPFMNFPPQRAADTPTTPPATAVPQAQQSAWDYETREDALRGTKQPQAVLTAKDGKGYLIVRRESDHEPKVIIGVSDFGIIDSDGSTVECSYRIDDGQIITTYGGISKSGKAVILNQADALIAELAKGRTFIIELPMVASSRRQLVFNVTGLDTKRAGL